MHGIEQAAGEAVVASRHVGDLHLAPLQPRNEASAPVLHHPHVHLRMSPPVPGEEARQHQLDHRRRGADRNRSGVAGPQRAGPFAELLRLGQQPPAAPQQVLPLGRQPDAAADAVEERHAELRLQHLNLPGGRRLAQVEARGRLGDASGIGDGNEGAQPLQVHRRLCSWRIERQRINALDGRGNGWHPAATRAETGSRRWMH